MPCCWEYVCMIVQKAETQLTSDPSWEDGLCYVRYCNQKQDEGTLDSSSTPSHSQSHCMTVACFSVDSWYFLYPQDLARLEGKADPNLASADGGTPLFMAIQVAPKPSNGHQLSIVHVRGPFMTAILNYAEGCHPGKVSVLRCLKMFPMFPWNAEQFLFPPLECQLQAGHYNLVERLLQVGTPDDTFVTCCVHCVHIYDMRSWYIKALHTQVEWTTSVVKHQRIFFKMFFLLPEYSRLSSDTQIAESSTFHALSLCEARADPNGADRSAQTPATYLSPLIQQSKMSRNHAINSF